MLPTKTEAKQWAAQTAIELNGPVDQAESTLTVSDMWNQWQKRYQDDRKLEQWERNKIANFQTYELPKVKLAELPSVHVTTWRDQRIKQVSAETVTREWNLMSGSCQSSAISDLGIIVTNPWRQAKRPPPTPARTKLPCDKELE